MSRMKFGFLMVFLSPFFFLSSGNAQAAKPLLDTTLTFAADGTATVKYMSYQKSGKDVEPDKIESALVFYALAMNKLDEASRKTLLGQIQGAVGRIATEKGLQRADVAKGASFVKPFAQAPDPAALKIVFAELPGQGHTLELQPENIGPLPLNSAVVYYFQDLTQNLSENGLRLMVLAMGGMNKWYREVGQASSPESVSQAPAYGLNLAVEILEKLSGSGKKSK